LIKPCVHLFSSISNGSVSYAATSGSGFLLKSQASQTFLVVSYDSSPLIQVMKLSAIGKDWLSIG